MQGELKSHYRTTEQAIINLEADFSALEEDEHKAREVLQQRAKALFRYHTSRVHDFQHERLIHLLVTLFFGFLFLGALAGFLVASFSWATTPILTILASILAGVLFITEIAYIGHYYQLENGVQRLYKLTERLRDLR